MNRSARRRSARRRSARRRSARRRSARRRSARIRFAAVSLGALVLVGVAYWLFLRPNPPDAAAASELLRRHNRAVALLEAGRPTAADPLLKELIEAPPPANPGVRAAALRNRAVGAVLAVDPEAGAALPPEERDAWFPRAEAAVAAFLRFAPDDPAAYYLDSRLAALAGDEDRSAAALLKSAANAPGEAWPRWRIYEAFSESGDAARRDAAGSFLREAVELEPENAWLRLNAVRAAAGAGRPTTAGAFAALRALLAPYAAGFAYRQAGGVPPLLDAGEAAARAGDWPAARRNAALLVNVLRSEEVVRADRLALERHPLDFLVPDLPTAFYESAGLDRTPDPTAIPVRYVPFADRLAPPDTENVRAAALVNFDLLGGDELVLLTDEGVGVYSRDAGAGWVETIAYSFPSGRTFTGLTTADLDLDSDAAPRAAAGRGGPAVACHNADPDLILWGPDGALLLENRLRPDGARELVPLPDQDNLRALRNVSRVLAADLDQEGDLDLLVLSESGLSLWFNRGNRTFEDRTDRSDVAAKGDLIVSDVLAVDLDRDVDLDVLLGAAGDRQGGGAPAAMLENLRHGEFRLHRGGGEPLGFAPLDADGNASWDLATADGRRIQLRSSVTPAPGRMSWGEPRTIATSPATRLRAVDHDNDGRVDLLAWGAGGVYLLRHAGEGWEDVSARLPPLASQLKEATPRDLDGDGDLDLMLLTAGGVELWENRGGEANASLQIALLAEFDEDGSDPKRCNHLGLGSLLELRRGPVYQPAVVTGAVTHFGLGPKTETSKNEAPAGEFLRALWTNGIPEVILDPESGALCHPQKLGGSCPYLYTWDGERFAFATDLCWAAPIGLQLAEGVFAPTRAWEHVKIDGPALRPRDGFYELRIACELWEAEYFDRIELACVDRPPDTHIFTNEKVGPPELVEPYIYAANALHEPAAARARSGGGKWRDALATVRTRDESYLKPFDATVTQGYTEPWELELDLAGAPRSGAVLLLTGWVFPTDTGLNVALSQNPDRGGPRPPRLFMETAGGWEPVLPNAGFPGGKTKTIALPLPDFSVLPGAPDRRRVRLAGTQELYWDRIAWCVPGGVETTTAPAQLVAAELRYRGFSARSWPASGHGPDRFDYHSVSRAPLWPPMAGPFTRYGDVREILTTADDRQAILASGDELALRFAAPPLREGWERDFVVSSVGYDKDANLHTVHGQGVLPLPHAAMTRYPPPPDEPFPDTPALREYLRIYQTRPSPGRAFWRAVRDGGAVRHAGSGAEAQ